MAPPIRVLKAFRAMKDLGIAEDTVKPVLKNLIKLYDKNWKLIEEENYRVLADAIFDYEETEDAEQKNKSKNADQGDVLEEEAHVHDEPERPLKMMRLRNHDGQASTSICNSSPSLGGNLFIKPEPEDAERPESCSVHQPVVKDKGKRPVSPENVFKEKILISRRPHHALQFREQSVEPGIVLLPERKVPDSHKLIETGIDRSLDRDNDQRQLAEKIVENGCYRSEKVNKHKGTECANSCSLVVAQQPQLTPHDIRLLHDFNDITRGEEKVKIEWKNEINNEHPPPFHYIPQNLVFKNAHMNFSLAHIGDDGCCSNCFGNCLSSSVPCACTHEFGDEFAYTLDGLLKEVFLEECKGHLATKIIRECWSKCGCHKHCGNRLVQRGITCNLQVFLTAEGKGWGLRTLEDLPKGAFVCEYVGEILTHTELRERKRTNSSEKHAYTVLLDADWGSGGLKAEEALCLDARCYGNVARFINHRCSDANLVEIPVQVETPDHHYYHLAFFTSRKVNALEELTWDYGVDFDVQNHSIKAFRCMCGSELCRDMKRTNCFA